MIYEKLRPMTREAYERAFRGAPDEASEGLLRLSWYEEDLPWAEEQCRRALDDPRTGVRLSAATGLAHVARRQEGLSAATVSRLRALRDDPDIGGRVEDALDDLAVFGRGE